MNNKNGKKKKQKNLPTNSNGGLFLWLMLILIVFYLFRINSSDFDKPTKEITYSEFYEIAKDNVKTDSIKSASMTENIVTGVFKDGKKFIVNLPANDQVILGVIRENIKNFDIKPPKTFWMNMMNYFLYTLLFVGLLCFFIYRPGGGS